MMIVVSKTCGACRHFLGICCDYGVCEREVRLAADAMTRESDPRWVSAMRMLSWASDNLVDAQDDACGRLDGFEWE